MSRAVAAAPADRAPGPRRLHPGRGLRARRRRRGRSAPSSSPTRRRPGRGRRGRAWLDEPGASLLVSHRPAPAAGAVTPARPLAGRRRRGRRGARRGRRAWPATEVAERRPGGRPQDRRHPAREPAERGRRRRRRDRRSSASASTSPSASSRPSSPSAPRRSALATGRAVDRDVAAGGAPRGPRRVAARGSRPRLRADPRALARAGRHAGPDA